MLIRSQNKKNLVNVDNITNIGVTQNNLLVVYFKSDEPLCIGKYSTEAKVIEILDIIANAYIKVHSKNDNVDYWTAMREAHLVFDMPEDEEVEG